MTRRKSGKVWVRGGSRNQARQRCIQISNARGPRQRIWTKTQSVLGKRQKTFKWLFCLTLSWTGAPLQMPVTRNSRSGRCQLPVEQSGRMEVSEDHPVDLSRKPWKGKSKGGQRELTWDRGLATASLEDPAETGLTEPIPQRGHENGEKPTSGKSCKSWEKAQLTQTGMTRQIPRVGNTRGSHGQTGVQENTL